MTRLNPGQMDTGSEWRFSKQVILRSTIGVGETIVWKRAFASRFEVSRRRGGNTRETSASEPPLDREIPVHAPVGAGDSRDVPAKISLQRWRPGHELKA